MKENDFKKKRTRQDFDEKFRYKVCLEYLSGGATKQSIQDKYNLKGHSTISKWLTRFGLQDMRTLHIKPVTMPKDKRIKQLQAKEQEYEHLQKKIQELESKSESLELLIKLAEDKFNIRIRKK